METYKYKASFETVLPDGSKYLNSIDVEAVSEEQAENIFLRVSRINISKENVGRKLTTYCTTRVKEDGHCQWCSTVISVNAEISQFCSSECISKMHNAFKVFKKDVEVVFDTYPSSTFILTKDMYWNGHDYIVMGKLDSDYTLSNAEFPIWTKPKGKNMLKEIVITGEALAGKDKLREKYTLGYIIGGYADNASMEYIQPIGWDGSGMALNRNFCKFSLESIESGDIPGYIKVTDLRKKANLEPVSCEECGHSWMKTKEITKVFCSDECRDNYCHK